MSLLIFHGEHSSSYINQTSVHLTLSIEATFHFSQNTKRCLCGASDKFFETEILFYRKIYLTKNFCQKNVITHFFLYSLQLLQRSAFH